MTELRAVVVIDYQNVHLTARDLFGAKGRPTHESLVDPLHFANQLILSRNDAQRSGSEHATLVEVLVFRGEPVAVHDPKAYSRSQAQRSQWERDPRVKVTLRSLRYEYERDVNGRKVIGPDGKWIVKGKPREKGIDVLCALAVVRCAHNPAFDLVILASQDTDLARTTPLPIKERADERCVQKEEQESGFAPAPAPHFTQTQAVGSPRSKPPARR